jgi:hypothetical protein
MNRDRTMAATFTTVRLIKVPLPYWCISTRDRFEITILKFRVTVHAVIGPVQRSRKRIRT